VRHDVEPGGVDALGLEVGEQLGSLRLDHDGLRRKDLEIGGAGGVAREEDER